MPMIDTGADRDVTRKQMPQIPQEQLAEYMRWLRLNDVTVSVGQVPAKLLHPVQDHVDRAKVEGMQQNLAKIKQQFVVVADGYFILDGHHRWVVLHEADPGTQVRIVHVHLPVNDAVELSNEFDGSYNAGIHETRLTQLVQEAALRQDIEGILRRRGFRLAGQETDGRRVWEKAEHHIVVHPDGYYEVDKHWGSDDANLLAAF